jgi:pantoate--beta-alanine ligase
MYPRGRPLTRVSVSGLTDRLCGATRPGHFDGVATVCTKLFAICEPDKAYFGEKDYQQLLVVKRLVADLNLPVEIVPCPLVREPDGLALSSRNARLSSEERAEALAISRSLFAAIELFERGERSVDALVDAVRSPLTELSLGEVDYVELLGADDLSPIDRVDRNAVLAVAVRFPSARLIDNVLLSA